ncbi:hypothetical protein CEP54_008837 [Fusarium duplospermum]|uniref:Zn(2)-C6 fungal-type domain-containing protein n=1 Tax=Fusarium duplospermum TaxID=1325734 RepID=A0A428PTS2_9HYPO|nr:hypothetical protein CEP54_008837 [Fusarium duplospermum]
MASRQPACDPCRRAKLACDHTRPICSRCRSQQKQGLCTYRVSPFKRKRASDSSPRQESRPSRRRVSQDASPTHHTSQTPAANRTYLYPNPGHIGLSSHVAIFNQIFPDQSDTSPAAATGHSGSPNDVSPEGPSLDDNPLARKGAELLKQLLEKYSLSSMENFVSFWIEKGINLALAEPFVALCAQISNYSCLSTFERPDWHLKLAQKLLANSIQPLQYDSSTSFSEYVAQFTGQNTRWETLGIFLCAVLRALIEIPFFPTLYTTEESQRDLKEKLLALIGCSLDVCLSLDCLNDLQHLIQYENAITYTYTSGDQSFFLYRRLGDVMASVFALGYHENLDAKTNTPEFLIQLRKAAFARIYSADKNGSLFLGRPPRLSKRFSCFQLPDSRLPLDCATATLEPIGTREWDPESVMNYRAETRWSALCAFVKEEVMELMFDSSCTDCRQKIEALQEMADSQWNALPAHFRLSTSIKQHSEIPFERDFVASTRLNYLHTTFLIRRLAFDRLSEPAAPLIEASIEMLKLAVEVMVLREELSNSGTRLTWKIAHYGLPAAGIIIMAMLNQHPTPACLRVSRSRVLQDLAVLVAEVERGTVVKAEDPNYAILSKATQIIQRFLDFINSEQSMETVPQLPEQQLQQPDAPWGPQLGQDLESEFSFWQGIADHPSLYSQYLLPPNEGLGVPSSMQGREET